MGLAARMMGGGLSAGQAKAINGDVNSAVSAAGTSQTDATQLTASINVVTTAAASSGVKLLSCDVGDTQDILNLGANAVTVYPDSGSRINAIATNGGFTLAVNTSVKLQRFTSTCWVAYLSA